MDYGLATFDGAHFAHIYARDEHQRLKRIADQGRRIMRDRRWCNR